MIPRQDYIAPPMIPQHCDKPMQYFVVTDDFWCSKCGHMVTSQDLATKVEHAPASPPRIAE